MVLKFLFVPVDAVGHVNAHTGIAQELLRKGHSIYFAVSNAWRGKLAPLGFTEKYYQGESNAVNLHEQLNGLIQALSPVLALPALESSEKVVPSFYEQAVASVKASYAKLRQIVDEVQPDLILVDGIYTPALGNAGIPWMIVNSHNPIGLTLENGPPASFGLSIMGDKSIWKKCRRTLEEAVRPIFKDFSDWVLEKGGPQLTYDGRSIWIPSSPYGNLYMYPEELNYTMHRPDPPNYYQFDTFARIVPGSFEIPQQLATGSGKLVYFSLGTIGSSDMGLMRKLIAFLAKSPNRFLVSKGPVGDQLELADNMWGANYLPQTNIIPLVDLIITHGGNNSVTEAFYFGTKLLVLPLFFDQLDNGQRVEETGFGLQFHPYRVSEEELLNGIEMLLSDDLLGKRMKAASARIKSSKSQHRAAELLENVARNNHPLN